MKIALIRKDYLHSGGGAERYVYNLSHEFAKNGQEVHIFANRWEDPQEQSIKIHPVPLIKINSPIKNLSFAFNLRKELSVKNFDIVHSFSHVYPSDIYRMGDGIHRIWLKIETPSIYLRFFKYINPRHLAILFLENRIFKEGNYKKIIVNSKLCYKQAVKYLNIPREKLVIIYNGVDHKIFNPEVKAKYLKKMREKLGIKEDARVILFVGDNFERKGLKTLIYAFAGIDFFRKNVYALIIGKRNPGRFFKLAKRLNIAERMIFMGQAAKMEEIYGTCDFLVLPSLYEPFSNVCLEAMACGLPVITSAINGASELIENGVNGFILQDPLDSSLLAQKINIILDDAKSKNIGKKAHEATTCFTLQSNAKAVLKVYGEILAEK